MTDDPLPRPWALLSVLALVAVLTTALVVVTVVASQFVTDVDGTTRELPLVKRITGDPARFLLPLALAIAAGGAAVGLARGLQWAADLAIMVGISVLLIGAFLLYQAAREWGLEGSFSALLVPPGAACVGIGAYAAEAARRARHAFRAGVQR